MRRANYEEESKDEMQPMKTNNASDSEDDIEDCPILKDQIGNFTPDQLKEMRKKYDEIVKPMVKNKKAEEAKKEPEPKKPEKKGKHPRFDKYRESQGSCPYMNTSMFLINLLELIEPSDETFNFGYNIRYKSQFDFVFNCRGRGPRAEFRAKRKEFDRYPIFLKHTLTHHSDINKARNADFGNAFFVFDDIKTEGNLYYEDQEYYTALKYYEQVDFQCNNKRHIVASSG